MSLSLTAVCVCVCVCGDVYWLCVCVEICQCICSFARWNKGIVLAALKIARNCLLPSLSLFPICFFLTPTFYTLFSTIPLRLQFRMFAHFFVWTLICCFRFLFFDFILFPAFALLDLCIWLWPRANKAILEDISGLLIAKSPLCHPLSRPLVNWPRVLCLWVNPWTSKRCWL